jgi:hypothetical protein
MKFCRDCKWVERQLFGLWVSRWADCLHPELTLPGKTNPVTGKTDRLKNEWASFRRIESGSCGPDAKLFEARR